MDYEDLPYEELRDRAFDLAEHRHDVGFFLDLFNHMPAMIDARSEGGDLGAIGGTILELVSAARQEFGEDNVGQMQPLFVARFATYLREHSGSS